MLFRSSRDVLLDHIAHVKSVVPLKNKIDATNAQLIETELKRFTTRHKILSRLRILVFTLLYASIASALSIPIITEVAQTFVALSSILGVGILSLIALYLTWRMRDLIDRIIILYAHLIAIYEKNNKKNIYSFTHLPA